MCALLTALALAARRSPSLSVASQLVGRIDGNARGILAPAVFSKRMLGTTRGSTDRQEHRGAAKEGALASAESAAPDAAAADGTPNLGLVDRHLIDAPSSAVPSCVGSMAPSTSSKWCEPPRSTARACARCQTVESR